MRTFESFHPTVLMVYFLAVLIPVMVIMNPWMILAAILFGLAWQTLREKRFPVGSVAFYFGLTCILVIVNAIIYTRRTTVLFYINNKSITWEGAVYGLTTGGMLSAALIWCGLMSRMITGDSLMVLLSGMPKLALLFTMILRLIPRYRRRYQAVEAACRINATEQKNDRVSMVVQSSAVMTFALENAMQTATSMEMRGYGSGKRTRMHTPFYRRDLICLVFILASNIGYFIESWIPVLLLGLYPLIYMGKEELRWAIHKKKNC